MLSLVWFRRDLRVHDHPALALGAAMGAVLPVHIVEPDAWAQPEASARHWAFVEESLAGLRADLAALGQPLILRSGDAVEVLARLHAKHGFGQIISHAETGTVWAQARDRRVADWASATGLRWRQLAQTEAAAPLTALAPVAEGTGALPTAKALKLAEDRCPNRQPGGRAAALQALDSFLALRGQAYRQGMTSPLGAERASSRLSPYLAQGVLSLREVEQASAAAREGWRGQRDWQGGLRAFEARLALRQTAMQRFDGEPPHLARPGEASLLSAWRNGETGLPFVDACMRYLRATGWLNARLRALLVTVATVHLGLEVRATGLHLARLFTDYEPAIHWPQVQAAATPRRIPDPVRLGLDLDPQGQFLRRWLPELAPVPDTLLHQPWLWPMARRVLAGRYPEPVVDPASAAREARRFDPAVRAPSRRAPRTPAQMALDL